jgi:PAS domain S-box-containing protein
VEFFQILFDALPIPVFHIDMNSTLLMCNQAFETVLQQVREEFLNRPVDEVVGNEELADVIRCPRVDESAISGPIVRNAEVPFMDGSRHDVEVRHMITFGLSGEPEGAVGMIIDLTDRMRAERAEIEAERLRAAKQLAISIAHEFNNPLMIISGVSQLLKSTLGDKLDEPLREHLDRIPRAVNRMKELVDRLMHLQKLQEATYAGGTSFIDLQASSGPGPNREPE